MFCGTVNKLGRVMSVPSSSLALLCRRTNPFRSLLRPGQFKFPFPLNHWAERAFATKSYAVPVNAGALTVIATQNGRLAVDVVPKISLLSFRICQLPR